MLVLTLALVALVLLIYFILDSTKRPAGFPPGPRWLPFIGCLPEFLSLVKAQGFVHLAWQELGRRYGELSGIKLGGDRIVVVNGFEAVRHVLCREDCDGRPTGFIWTVRTFGQRMGVVTTDGSLWREQRRFSVLHLKNAGLKGDAMEKMILDEAQDLVKMIRESCEKSSDTQKQNGCTEVELTGLCCVSVINVLWGAVAGKRFDIKDERLNKLFHSLHAYFKLLDMTGGILNFVPALRFVAPERTGYNLIKRTVRNIQDFLSELIDEHRSSLQEDDKRDLIDAYLLEIQNQRETNFTDNQLLALLLDLFMAGAETTNNTLGFSLLLMVRHPDIQLRAQEHLDRVVGRVRLPCLADRPKLVYLDAVLMEAQRFSCVLATTVAHRTLKDCEILGHRVPQDSTLVLNLWSVMMDPEYWRDPQVFRPERFLDASGENLIKEERFIPFGIGKRRCLGEPLARSSLFLFLTALLHNFHLEAAPGQEPPSLTPLDGLTLAPQRYTARLVPRL